MPNILHRLSIDAPPERVHHLAATREGIQRWWTGHPVAGDDEIGGRFEVYFREPANPAATFEVVECSPGRIVWRCADGPHDWIDTRITYALKPRDDGGTTARQTAPRRSKDAGSDGPLRRGTTQPSAWRSVEEAMPASRSLPTAILAALVLLSFAASTAVATGGRVVVPVGLPTPQPDVDAAGASQAVAVPGGDTLLFGLDTRTKAVVVAALRPDGTVDGAFGTRGVSRVPKPGTGFMLLDVLRRPDGRLLIVGSGMPASKYELGRLLLLQLTPSGAVDTTFGTNGVATAAIEAGCGNCEPAALAADGSIVLVGATGTQSPEIETNPNAPNTFTPAIARLTPSGAPDPSFGQNGVRQIPGTSSGSAFGYGVDSASAGRFVVLAAQGRSPVVTRLLADGSADPTFNGGTPLALPQQDVLHLAARPGDVTSLLGFHGLVRVGPTGAVTQNVPIENGGFARLLPVAAGTDLVYAPKSYEPRSAPEPAVTITRVDASGSATTTPVSLPFGGGVASFSLAKRRILPVPRLDQNAFRIGELVPRADGGFLASGGVTISQPTGEGAGFSGARFAAAGLTPSLQLDDAYGPTPHTPLASVRAADQHARSDYSLKRVLVRLTASTAGLARIRVFDTRNHLLADGVEPSYRSGPTSVRVPIAKSGLTVLRRGRVSVRVSATFRDEYGQTVRLATVRAVLR
jgi:uncharacterized delta-60 repeat protein